MERQARKGRKEELSLPSSRPLRSFGRALARGLLVLTHRDAADHDLDDEVQHYLEEAAAAFAAKGLSPEEARRAARLELGNATVVREQVRAGGWEHVIGTLLSDLRYGARRLGRNPGFAAVGVLTLALGIGASTAIFSAVNPILFESLPYPGPDRIVTISDVGDGDSHLDVTFGTYREVAARSRSFDAFAVMKPWQPTLTGAAEPERLEGQRVSADYFRALGVPPMPGRSFQRSEDREGGPKVVILSDRLVRRRFGGDPAIVGRQIRLDDYPYTVVGVMPATFENVVAPSAELWAPLQYATSFTPDSREWGHHLRMIGRIQPGTARSDAVRELDQIAHTRLPDFPRVPWASLQSGLVVRSLQDEITYAVKPALLAVLGAVLLVLVIACVNVTNLLLARGARRRGEFAMRAALGAGRGRLVRQLLTESLLLAMFGGALGMVLAEIGVRALVMLSPPDLPRLDAIRLDAVVFAFALGVTTLIGVLVGIIPALHASRADLREGLQRVSLRSSSDHRNTRGALVVAEVALALVLLVSAGLLLRSLQRVFAVDVGFDAANLLTMQVQESGRRFETNEARYEFFDEALEAARRVPGVTAAAFTSLLPLSGDIDTYGVHFERDADRTDDGAALRYAVTPDYFEVMRIPLRRGRLLDSHDSAAAPRVAVISESFANRRFRAGDPIGQRFTFGPDDGRWFTIVGVVGDVKQASLALTDQDAVYVSPTQWHWADKVMSLVIRSPRDATTLASEVRQAIWSVDKDQPVVRVATIEQLVEKAAVQRRFALTLFEAFALAALSLAAIGIYGVLSGSVAERTREIGVRSALGASRGEILALVLHQGLTLTGVGVLIGVSGAVVASRVLVTLLFGISHLDPITYAGVIVLLLLVSTVACWIPASRAAGVDPSITLRAE
jgi:putative ABC transport system permease protein